MHPINNPLSDDCGPAIRHHPFFFDHVQAGSGNGPVIKRLDERVSIDQVSTSGIDDENAVATIAKRLAIQKVIGRRSQRSMQRDNIRAALQFIQGHISKAENILQLRLLADVIGEDFHLKGLGKPNDMQADLASPDDP